MSYSNNDLEQLVEPKRFHRKLYTDPEIFDLEIFWQEWVSLDCPKNIIDIVHTDKGAPPIQPG